MRNDGCGTSRSGCKPLVGKAVGRPRPGAQHGVVLVVALVMLVVVSVIASVSMRNAASTEIASGAVRTTELALQAAEIALGYCEKAVEDFVKNPAATTNAFTRDNILPPGSNHWQSPANWDNPTGETLVGVPLALLNGAVARTTYKRPPECMVAPLPVMLKNQLTPSDDVAFVVTARGFGPEVPDGKGRPAGSEVWLQSHIQLD